MPIIEEARRRRFLEDSSIPAIYREYLEILERVYLVKLKSLRDLRYLLKARELHHLLELPQPLSLEISHLKQSRSPRYKPRSLIRAVIDGDERPIRRHATAAERSRYIAEYMRTYARHHDLRILHVLVGLSHESEIAYFLRHPQYRLPEL